MRVTLNGIVAADEDVEIYELFGFTAFGPERVRQAIAENPAGEELIFEINSPGGSVMAGSEMYSVLRSAEGVRSRAEIQSMAASAASYLCLGCTEVMISPVAQMMIHLPSTSTQGDRTEHLRSVRMLDSTREAILNAYELKAAGKTDRAELRRMMTSETWLTAQEALDKGLVDGILYQDSAAPQNLMNALIVGVPDIALLRDEYHKRKSSEPEIGHDANCQSWQTKARLAIENNRFI